MEQTDTPSIRLHQVTLELTANGMTARISPRELSQTIMQRVCREIGPEDDAGLDWMTDDKGGIYIGGLDWYCGQNEPMAILVDAANFFTHGKTLKVKSAEFPHSSEPLG